jgi:hypothetical protein
MNYHSRVKKKLNSAILDTNLNATLECEVKREDWRNCVCVCVCMCVCLPAE